jgi:O-methyltransferase
LFIIFLWSQWHFIVRKGSLRTAIVPSSAPQCLLVFGAGFPKPGDRNCLLDLGASLYIQAMRKILVGAPLEGSYDAANPVEIKPYNDRARYYGQDWPPYGYTMIGLRRLDNFRCAIQEVNRRKIPGAIVELGVWRGGAMILASAIGKETKTQRDLYLFDCFGKIESYSKFQESKRDFLAVSVDQVKSYFDYFEVNGPHVHFEKGFFSQTLPNWKDREIEIAVLRVDGNFYDSYQDAFYYLYEKVPVGGIVILDDLSKKQRDVMRFWLDFKSEQGLPEDPVNIDGSSAWFRKEKAVSINWEFFRPPQDVNFLRNETVAKR